MRGATQEKSFFAVNVEVGGSYQDLFRERRQNMSLRQAFTLIELLVVIAIISILAAILFPVFAMCGKSPTNIVLFQRETAFHRRAHTRPEHQ
jgi:prepilin-type N-terminal cleavage/methylation domain-containing protein